MIGIIYHFGILKSKKVVKSIQHICFFQIKKINLYFFGSNLLVYDMNMIFLSKNMKYDPKWDLRPNYFICNMLEIKLKKKISTLRDNAQMWMTIYLAVFVIIFFFWATNINMSLTA